MRVFETGDAVVCPIQSSDLLHMLVRVRNACALSARMSLRPQASFGVPKTRKHGVNVVRRGPGGSILRDVACRQRAGVGQGTRARGLATRPGTARSLDALLCA